MNVDGRACTIVGVLDPSIEFGNLSLTDVWMPIAADPAAGRRDDRRYSVVGRLKPGVTLEQADGEIRTITERLAREFPATNAGWSARVAPTRGDRRQRHMGHPRVAVAGRRVRAPHRVRQRDQPRAGARVGPPARAGGPDRAWASRWRTLRLLLVEGLVLGAAGGVLGLVLVRGFGCSRGGVRAVLRVDQDRSKRPPSPPESRSSAQSSSA